MPSPQVYRRPELGATDRQHSLVSFSGVASNSGAFVLALVLALIFPQVGPYWLLILLVTFPLDRIVKPRLRAATGPSGSPSGNVADTSRG